MPFRNGGHIGADLAHCFRNRGYQSAGRCLCCGGFPAVTRFARHLRWLDTSTECGLFSADYRGRIGDKGMEAVSPSWGQEAFSFQKEIRIEHLTYAYPESKEVLKDFCCTIRKGEYVGICGESGVGKSTLFNLLLGFITPDKGAIRIDGRPLADVPRQEWHRKVGYVQQEVFVLDGTLAENIALGCRSIDKERVAEIVRLVRLDAWVDELPQGMDTPLGEGGGRLSGGQKQRVGIARALYKKAEVLLLDEATSALDNETERAVNEMLLGLMKECRGLTVLTIAHRESSLAYCHRVIRLNGKDNGSNL